MDQRIFGTETEYALVLDPPPAPDSNLTRREIFDLFRATLESQHPSVRSLRSKEGIFLQNGGFFHYEAQVHAFSQGLLEASTPECLSADDLATYQVAQDRILWEALRRVREKLLARGYHGTLRLGKNSTDGKGNFYGTHENYLVDDPLPASSRAVMMALFPFFRIGFWFVTALTFLPLLVLVIFGLTLWILFVMCTVGQFFPVLRGPAAKARKWLERLGAYLLSMSEDRLIGLLGFVSRIVSWPWAVCYSAFLRLFIFRAFRRHLISFLVTRQILTGSGRVVFSEGGAGYELSQKTECIGSLCRVYWDERTKPLIDIKTFVLDPWAIFHPRKRLHILGSDSNMSEATSRLKAGITGLVIGMIESGVNFDRLRLRHPVKALRAVSRDVRLAERLPLADGGSLTAIEIQRAYLEEAKRFYLGREATSSSSAAALEGKDERTVALLKEWEGLLVAMTENPFLLYKDLDWVAKLDLIEQALRGKGGLASLAPWSTWILKLAEKVDLVDGQTEEGARLAVERELTSKESQELASRLSAAGKSYKDLLDMVGMWLVARKIDLKYHEVDFDEGYYFQLSAEGLARRVTEDGAVEEAISRAPRGTRAWVRGAFIRICRERGMDARANWKELWVRSPRRRISLSDPFADDEGPLESLK